MRISILNSVIIFLITFTTFFILGSIAMLIAGHNYNRGAISILFMLISSISITGGPFIYVIEGVDLWSKSKGEFKGLK